jgi:heme/copper-type cytochrome/quinol oxidase subunit 4
MFFKNKNQSGGSETNTYNIIMTIMVVIWAILGILLIKNSKEITVDSFSRPNMYAYAFVIVTISVLVYYMYNNKSSEPKATYVN